MRAMRPGTATAYFHSVQAEYKNIDRQIGVDNPMHVKSGASLNLARALARLRPYDHIMASTDRRYNEQFGTADRGSERPQTNFTFAESSRLRDAADPTNGHYVKDPLFKQRDSFRHNAESNKSPYDPGYNGDYGRNYRHANDNSKKSKRPSLSVIGGKDSYSSEPADSVAANVERNAKKYFARAYDAFKKDGSAAANARKLYDSVSERVGYAIQKGKDTYSDFIVSQGTKAYNFKKGFGNYFDRIVDVLFSGRYNMQVEAGNTYAPKESKQNYMQIPEMKVEAVEAELEDRMKVPQMLTGLELVVARQAKITLDLAA
jgi:hypothetical protein